MFEKYTEKARRTIFFGRYESSQCGSRAIEPEHILLGLLREDEALILKFVAVGVTAETLRAKVVKEAAITGERISTSVELPLSAASKRVLAYAHEESVALSHRHIGSEHLLLGLLREEGSVAAEVLRRSGVDIDEVRSQVEM